MYYDGDATLDELKLMSMNPVNSRILGQDFTLIGGFVLLLSDQDDNRVVKILEILLNLIRNENNRQYLKEFIGIRDQLDAIENNYLSGTIIHMLAKKLKQELYKEEFKRKTCLYRRESKKPGNLRVNLTQKYLIQFENLQSMDEVGEIKNCLADIPGVTSITFQLSEMKVIVKTSKLVTSSKLIQSLRLLPCIVSGNVDILDVNNQSLRNLSLRGYLDEENEATDTKGAVVNDCENGRDSKHSRWSSIVSRVTSTLKDYFW